MPQSMLWNLYEYVLSLIEAVLFFDFSSFMLGEKKNIKNRYYYSSILLLSIFVFILTKFNINFIWHVVLVYLVLLIISCKMFCGNIKEKILFVTMFYFFLMFGDVVAVSIISKFIGKDARTIIASQTWARILFSQISKLLLFIILRIIKNNYVERELDIPRYYWYWILLIYLISGINLLVIFSISLILNELGIRMNNLIITINISSLLIVGITYYVFMKLNKFYKEKNSYKIIEIKNEMLTKEIEEKEKIYEEIRKTHHDFKNHIICIEKLLEHEKLELASEYIDNLKKEKFQVYTWIKTGNDVVDAILNQKKSEGISKNINIDIKAVIPNNININPMDMCVILGNALDNGIEANEKIVDIDERNIKVRIKPYKDYLFIEISNPTVFNPIDEDGKLKTSKEDKQKHGFGIKSIKSVVDKYNGILSYEYNKGKFILSIMLPI